MERLVNLDPQLLHDTILMAIAVFVLFMLMSYLLFNPVRKMLEDRKTRIKDDIASAKADKQDAAVMKAEYEARMQNVDKEAETILSEARKKALQNEARIVEDAKEEAAQIIKRAKEEALLEKKRVLDEMKQEMISIASLMAKKAVAETMDIQIQDALIEETLKEIGEHTWQS